MAGLFHGIGHFPADAENGGVRSLGEDGGGAADGVGVEAAAERGVGGDRDERDFSALLLGGERFPRGPSLVLLGGVVGKEGRQHAGEGVAVGDGGCDGLLGLAELGRGHELHRRSNLQRAPYRADTRLYFLQGSHSYPILCFQVFSFSIHRYLNFTVSAMALAHFLSIALRALN